MDHRQEAFSLVELLIVLMILAILAAIAVPKLVDASDDARESALATDLQMLRRQIQAYKMQHGDRGPHLNEGGSADHDNLVPRMLGRTETDGKLSASGTCGPYIKEWPTNPFCGEATAGDVTFGTDTAPPRDDSTGWYYNTDTCMISPNTQKGATEFDPDG